MLELLFSLAQDSETAIGLAGEIHKLIAAAAFLTLIQSLLPDRDCLATGAFTNPSAVLSSARHEGGVYFFYYG